MMVERCVLVKWGEALPAQPSIQFSPDCSAIRIVLEDFPGSPVVKTRCFQWRRCGVRSLVGERRSHIPGRAAKNKHRNLKLSREPPLVPGCLVTVIEGGVPHLRVCNGGGDGGTLKGGFEGGGCRSGMRSFPPPTSWALHLVGSPHPSEQDCELLAATSGDQQEATV